MGILSLDILLSDHSCKVFVGIVTVTFWGSIRTNWEDWKLDILAPLLLPCNITNKKIKAQIRIVTSLTLQHKNQTGSQNLTSKLGFSQCIILCS